MEIPERIDALMANRQIKNRSELARLSGIPYTTIDGIYKKPVDNITLKTLRRLADFFGCTIDFLVSGLEGEKEIFFTPEDHILLVNYKELNAEGRRKVRDYAVDIYDRYRHV